ncbi:MAG: SPFH/Band 7/PHB domain protein [Hyphomicrobiales bacterium]|uniref:SPFH domain-containing protein n=1 Tax=Rhabdaerophilum calidifontis TaxID=2604328 RepID=UPI00123932B9|nr:SPFH domain-containing protein [Rhabdaerophilum calidifontis]MCA1952808.1 SPFH/Band 7/PHB domain protein [Hyphomicrobiales bacterium]MCA1999441.1 SPFH/Band 7/PHB domain protein [Hyphomicrobiales bacterium]
MFLDAGQWVALIFVAFALVTLMAGIRQVPQGKHYTVERFGRYHRTLTPGLGLVIPYIETVGAKIVMMEQVLDVPTQEVITKDNASAKVDGVIFYQVTDASRATYQVAQLDYALLNLTMTNIRNVMGSMDLDQLLSNRDDINQKLLAVVDAAASPWGVKVTRIELKNIEPPADLAAAMARQMKAERDRRAAILEAEGQRQAAILKAEGEKQAQILAAEGRKEAAFRDAEARERGAEAEANATRLVSEAIARGNIGAVNYLIAEKYVAAFAKLATAPNQKTVIVPAEMGGLIGTLGGIAEIARETFAEGGRESGRGEAPRRPWPDQPKA